ncbi:MAG: rhodanese-like domain-containing protein [Betaproteobacteria bacterium]|nr:rhodanese-like domain-containing protein [Betaproteobacteria bacterium]
MKFKSYFAVAALAAVAFGAQAQDYRYIAPDSLKQRLQAGDKPLLIDIQVEKEFSQHHLPGALPTYAYPAKSEAEREKLKPAVSRILASKEDVVIVCPGGGSGAKNTVDYLKSQGVPEKRLLILEKGQKGWPYADLVQKGP